MIINKIGPFRNDLISDDYCLLGKLLSYSADELEFLPDFSEDKKVLIFSDFGGEHSSAKYVTYSFLFCSGDKIGVFQENIKTIRLRSGMNEPYKEYEFKELKYRRIRDSIKEYFFAVDHFIHGVVLTVSVEKEIANLFNYESNSFSKSACDILLENGCGEWKRKDAEKVLRITHILGFYISLLCHSGQKILWMCDNDAINENGKKRNFKSTQRILMKCLPLYSKNHYELFGFCRSFDKDELYGDLLSVPDFAAGIVQEVLSAKFKNLSDEIDESKIEPLKWMVSKSQFMSKINIRIFKDEDIYRVSNDLFEAVM